ncbi:MAG: proton-conducting transporter membrane subunit [Bacillota bacterium]|nr:proton-conducting transporter membrane subunit [Bacillota bacterium]
MIRHLPVFTVVGLLICAYLLPLFKSRFRVFGQIFTLLALIASAVASLYFLITTGTGEVIRYAVGGWNAPYGIEIMVTPLTAVVMLIVSTVTALVYLYRIFDTSAPQGQAASWYDAVILLLVAGIFGIAQASDLFNLFVFIEICSLSACALVAASKEAKAAEAAFKYLMLCTIGSGFVLFAIGLLYIITGYLSFSYVHDSLQTVWMVYPHAVYLSASFFIVGLGIKAALFPLHVWLPDAHSAAPTTSSALLSAIAVKAYILALFKLFYLVFGQDLIQKLAVDKVLLFLGVAGVLGGSLFALVQSDMKRMLAYSTVAQLGYIFIGIGLGNVAGLTAAIFQFASHATMKATLFLVAGYFASQGKKKLVDYAGLGKTEPVMFGAFTVAALSMIGFPLLSGFITKWYLFKASLDLQQYGVVIVIVLSGLLNAAYFLPVLWLGWFGSEKPYTRLRLRPSHMLPVALSILVVYLGIAPNGLLKVMAIAVTQMLRW